MHLSVRYPTRSGTRHLPHIYQTSACTCVLPCNPGLFNGCPSCLARATIEQLLKKCMKALCLQQVCPVPVQVKIVPSWYRVPHTSTALPITGRTLYPDRTDARNPCRHMKFPAAAAHILGLFVAFSGPLPTCPRCKEQNESVTCKLKTLEVKPHRQVLAHQAPADCHHYSLPSLLAQYSQIMMHNSMTWDGSSAMQH